MSSTSYDSIRMIIGDTNSAVRQGIKTALFAHGFRNIRDASRLPTLHGGRSSRTRSISLSATAPCPRAT